VSHLDEYLPSHKTSSVEVAKAKPELGENADKTDTNHPVSDSGGGKSKSSKSRHNRDWKGLVTDDTQPPPLRSTIADHVQHEEKAHCIPLRARQSVSPEPAVHRKRNRPDERTQLKVGNYCCMCFFVPCFASFYYYLRCSLLQLCCDFC